MWENAEDAGRCEVITGFTLFCYVWAGAWVAYSNQRMDGWLVELVGMIFYPPRKQKKVVYPCEMKQVWRKGRMWWVPLDK